MFKGRRRASGELRRMIDSGARAAEIAEYLDGLGGQRRVAEALSVGGRRQGRLYDALGDAEPLSLEDIVPPELPPSATVFYEGRNSMPTFDRFQKRFARVGADRLVGYNHQFWSPLTGPGYFVVKPGSPNAAVPGELYFDYTEAPGHEPTGWPDYRRNDWGVSLLVFAWMKDYMRRVARGVIIGTAYKRDKPMGQYFILGRAE